jgi:RimJ/RimL family protein N-acetyltransferase
VRCFRPGDGAVYFHALRANRDHLHEFMPPSMADLQSEQDAEILIRQRIAEWQLRQLFIFGVWENQTGAYAGETYLANADWHVPCIELGYFVLQDQTGRGIATEAARGAIRYAFEHLRVSRVELQVAGDNTASMRVAERCGFRLEGRQRGRHRKKDGTIVDRLWYGLLRSEWQDTTT